MQITATASAAFHFTRWSGQTNGCTFSGNVITVPMTMPRAITANFAIDPVLVVATPYGGARPPAGTNWLNYGIATNASVTNSPVLDDKTQYVCKGWTGTGNVPASGANTNTPVFTMTTDSTITWLWRTNYWLDVGRVGGGRLSTGDCWLALGTNIQVTATPSNHWHFAAWSGDTNGCTLASNKITAPMTSPRSITANFAMDQHTLRVTRSRCLWPPWGDNVYDDERY